MARKSSGRRIGTLEYASQMDEAFFPHRLSLYRSAAWRGRTHHCARLLEFLEIEHISNAGKCNGQLIATYNQLQGYGIGRQYITKAIQEGEALGLLKVEHLGRMSRNKNYANLFTLTYVASQYEGMYRKPTDEWLRITKEQVEAIQARIYGYKQKQNPKSKS